MDGFAWVFHVELCSGPFTKVSYVGASDGGVCSHYFHSHRRYCGGGRGHALVRYHPGLLGAGSRVSRICILQVYCLHCYWWVLNAGMDVGGSVDFAVMVMQYFVAFSNEIAIFRCCPHLDCWGPGSLGLLPRSTEDQESRVVTQLAI